MNKPEGYKNDLPINLGWLIILWVLSCFVLLATGWPAIPGLIGGTVITGLFFLMGYLLR